MADTQVVKDYADDLRSLLTKSSITEQRNFFKSFVERIDVDAVEMKVCYAIPDCSWTLTKALQKFRNILDSQGGDKRGSR